MTPKNNNSHPSAPKSAHKLELDNHRALSISGVTAVPVFTDKSLIVRLADETLCVHGHDLNVKNLDVENGKLNITGYVTQLKYTSPASPGSLLKKIFK